MGAVAQRRQRIAVHFRRRGRAGFLPPAAASLARPLRQRLTAEAPHAPPARAAFAAVLVTPLLAAKPAERDK